jgi:hypothetical protein
VGFSGWCGRVVVLRFDPVEVCLVRIDVVGEFVRDEAMVFVISESEIRRPNME